MDTILDFGVYFSYLLASEALDGRARSLRHADVPNCLPLVMSSLFQRIAYIYIGTSRFEADKDFYQKKLGARKVWEFEEFGARVAAFDLCGEPYLLLADHVKAPSKRLIFQVESLSEASASLMKNGWKPDGEEFEVPDGPCLNFKDESGNEYAILEMKRPRILEGGGQG